MSELIRGAVEPLFDRLASEPSQPGDSGLATMESIQDSIGRDLRRLFNTRSVLAPADYAQGPATVLEYGIPDLQSFGAQDGAALRQLARGLQLAIERYEPRLNAPTVDVVAAAGHAETASVRIAAQVRIGTELRRVNFEMLLGTADSLVRVA